MRNCWNCRRRRAKCDGLRPSCQKCQVIGAECLGYGKLITWVGGIASRGHMKDSTFKTPTLPPSSPPPTLGNPSNTANILKYVNYSVAPGDGSLAVQHHPNLGVEGKLAAVKTVLWIPRALANPIFQDFHHDARELIDYYVHSICSGIMMVDNIQNPYRDVIALVGSSKGVANAMMAVAACHSTHSRVGCPVFLGPQGRALDGSTLAEMNRCILFKQRALAYLAHAVLNPLQETKVYILATIILLVLLELYEGGTGSWNVHLEGAKQLIDADRDEGGFDSPCVVKNILEELCIFDALGSAFVQPGLPTLPLSTRLEAKGRDELSSLSGLGCPLQILAAIQSVNLQWRAWADYKDLKAPTLYEPPLQLLSTTLMEIIHSDVEKWTDQVLSACSKQCPIPRGHVLQLSTIWKLSAEIYTSHVLCQLNRRASPTTHLRQLMAAIDHLDSVSGQTRFLLWPVFIVGAESTITEDRQWTLRMLDKIWDLAHMANAKTAAIVLADIWRKHDLEVQTLEIPSWMAHLSSLGTCLLFL